MTPIDLRIKYRSETGLSPTYGRDRYDECNYRGALTYQYTEWIENIGVDTKYYHGRKPYWKRLRFRKNTGCDATYYYKGLLYYRKVYKEWLEEKYCEANTVLEKIHR